MTFYEPEWKDWTIKVLQINISTWCTEGLRKTCHGGSSSTMLKDDILSNLLTGPVALYSLHWPMCSEYQTSTAWPFPPYLIVVILLFLKRIKTKDYILQNIILSTTKWLFHMLYYTFLNHNAMTYLVMHFCTLLIAK